MLFTPRFECVRELEEWTSAIQFNYVGSSPNKSATVTQCYELSNKEDKQNQEQQQQQQQQQVTRNSSTSTASASSSMSEQLVEVLVKLLQTGMRTGLRGGLEVIKVLDRLPETIYVPVPNSSFSASQLEKPSRWFRSREEYETFIDVCSNGTSGATHKTTTHNRGSGSAPSSSPSSGLPSPVLGPTTAANNSFFFPAVPDPRYFDLVPLPMKFVRSALFVVNSAASSALTTTASSTTTESSPNLQKKEGGSSTTSSSSSSFTSIPETSSSSPLLRLQLLLPKTAASQLRMFLRLCLQQRCLLAVVELLVGFLKQSSDGALSEFLFVHPSASPLTDDLGFPQVMECIRKFGGPPLVIRAAANQCNLSIGPLLESPWDPEVAASISSDSPLTASWSMWFASKGLRLKWNLEFNLPADNNFPDYVAVDVGAEGCCRLSSLNINGSGAGSSSSSKNTHRGGVDAFEGFDDSGSATGRTTEGGKKVIRRIVKKKTSGGGNMTTTTTTTTRTVVTTGTPVGGTGYCHINNSNNSSNNNNNNNFYYQDDDVQANGSIGDSGESPRPQTASSAPAATLPGRGSSGSTGVASTDATPRRSAAAATIRAANLPPLSPPQVPSQPPPTRVVSTSSSKIPLSITNTSSRDEIDSNIQFVETKKKAELEFVDKTITRWREECSAFLKNSVGETVQPLLEAYAVLVYTKWSAALASSTLSETRIMECLDNDADVDKSLFRETGSDDGNGNDDDSSDEF